MIHLPKAQWIKYWMEVSKNGTKEEIAEYLRMYTSTIPY